MVASFKEVRFLYDAIEALIWLQAGIVYFATIATRSRSRTTCAYLILQAPTMGVTKFIFYMVELAWFTVDSLSFRKSRRRCSKYWVNGATCCLLCLERFFGKDLNEFDWFWHRLIVYSWRWSTVTDGRCQDKTSNDPFSRCQSVQLTITSYSLTTSTKVNYKIQKKRTRFLVLRLRSETEHDINDNVTTKTHNPFNTAQMNTDTWVLSSLAC